MKIAFFDTKPYDKASFEKYGKEYGVSFKYFETKLNEDTVKLANGFDGRWWRLVGRAAATLGGCKSNFVRPTDFAFG